MGGGAGISMVRREFFPLSAGASRPRGGIRPQ
jgi:hypothetical protein